MFYSNCDIKYVFKHWNLIWESNNRYLVCSQSLDGRHVGNSNTSDINNERETVFPAKFQLDVVECLWLAGLFWLPDGSYE